MLPTSNKDDIMIDKSSDLISKLNIPVNIEKKTTKDVIDKELSPAVFIDDTMLNFCCTISRVSEEIVRFVFVKADMRTADEIRQM